MKQEPAGARATQVAEAVHHLRGGGSDRRQRLTQRLPRDLKPAAQPYRAIAVRLRRGLAGGRIARVRGRGDPHHASALERWLRDVETGFEDRVLPVTLAIAAAWGRQQYVHPSR